jgi:hypothetical protein
MTEVAREQVLALRLARHHLAERLAPGEADAAAVVGLQDTPPLAAGIALAARLRDATPGDLGTLAIVESVRGAPAAVAHADLAIFTLGLAPPDEEAAAALIGNAAKALGGIAAMDALDRVSDAVRDALADGPLDRDAFHQALRERLPGELLWWCRGCQSHHVHPSLWRATGVRGVLGIGARDGRAPIFAAPPEAPPVEDPGAALARRFLHAYGPATPALLAGWSGTASSHARALWARAGELAEVRVDGRRAWVLAEDVTALEAAERPRGVRLIGGYDPYLAARDRELLLGDGALRKRLWRSLANPGAVLRDGELAGTWRATRKGRRLVVAVEPFGRRLRASKRALADEAATLAPWRGAERAELTGV